MFKGISPVLGNHHVPAEVRIDDGHQMRGSSTGSSAGSKGLTEATQPVALTPGQRAYLGGARVQVGASDVPSGSWSASHSMGTLVKQVQQVPGHAKQVLGGYTDALLDAVNPWTPSTEQRAAEAFRNKVEFDARLSKNPDDKALAAERIRNHAYLVGTVSTSPEVLPATLSAAFLGTRMGGPQLGINGAVALYALTASSAFSSVEQVAHHPNKQLEQDYWKSPTKALQGMKLSWDGVEGAILDTLNPRSPPRDYRLARAQRQYQQAQLQFSDPMVADKNPALDEMLRAKNYIDGHDVMDAMPLIVALGVLLPRWAALGLPGGAVFSMWAPDRR